MELLLGIIGGICFCLGPILTEALSWDEIIEKKFNWGYVVWGVGAILLIILAITPFSQKPKQKIFQYPAYEYNLELRVTEYQGKRDTTYILIEKPDSCFKY